MVFVHSMLGLVTMIVAVALVIWNGFRLGRRLHAPSYRMVLVGLLDLQVLLGIITFIVHPVWGSWLLHPLLMIVTVALAHILLKETKSTKTQFIGYVVVLLLLLLGVSLPAHV